MKIGFAIIAIVFTFSTAAAQSANGKIHSQPVPKASTHGTVVSSVAKTTSDGKTVSTIASSKSNGKKTVVIPKKGKHLVVKKRAVRTRTRTHQ